MLALEGAKRPERGGAAERRTLALAEANWFGAMAWTADRDGGLKGELRVADARAAARMILRQAKRVAVVKGMANQSLVGRPQATDLWIHGVMCTLIIIQSNIAKGFDLFGRCQLMWIAQKAAARLGNKVSPSI